MQSPSAAAAPQAVNVTIPSNTVEGGTFFVMFKGIKYSVVCPIGSSGGDLMRLEIAANVGNVTTTGTAPVAVPSASASGGGGGRARGGGGSRGRGGRGRGGRARGGRARGGGRSGRSDARGRARGRGRGVARGRGRSFPTEPAKHSKDYNAKT